MSKLSFILGSDVIIISFFKNLPYWHLDYFVIFLGTVFLRYLSECEWGHRSIAGICRTWVSFYSRLATLSVVKWIQLFNQRLSSQRYHTLSRIYFFPHSFLSFFVKVQSDIHYIIKTKQQILYIGKKNKWIIQAQNQNVVIFVDRLHSTGGFFLCNYGNKDTYLED